MVKQTLVFALVLFFSGSNVTAQQIDQCGGCQLPESALEFLRDTLKEAGQPGARVSSFERTAADQASAILNIIKRDGVEAAKQLYGALGDAVIDVYVAAPDKTDAVVLPLMTAKVSDQVSAAGVNRTQLMHVLPTQHTTFDIAPSSINSSAFEAVVRNHPDIKRLFVPGGAEKAYHIELDKGLNTISGTWSGRCYDEYDTTNVQLTIKRENNRYTSGIAAEVQTIPATATAINRKSRTLEITLNIDGDTQIIRGRLNNDLSQITADLLDDDDVMAQCEWSK